MDFPRSGIKDASVGVNTSVSDLFSVTNLVIPESTAFTDSSEEPNSSEIRQSIEIISTDKNEIVDNIELSNNTISSIVSVAVYAGESGGIIAH